MGIEIRSASYPAASRHDLFLTAAAGILVVFALWGTDLPASVCLFRKWTGFSCLTCGLSRSLDACVHGALLRAFRFHPFGPLLFASACFVLVNQASTWIFRKRLRFTFQPAVRRIVFISITAAALLFWVIRFSLEL